jgi:hypothetical protein
MNMSGYGRRFGRIASSFGSDTKGHDVKAYGDTTGKYIEWDASTDTFTISGTLAYSGGFSPTDWTNVAVVGTLACSGSFAINTNKFTVAGASGNTVVAGTLAVTGTVTSTGNFAVGANTLTVAASSGNTAVAGTLAVTGTTTSTGNLTVGSNKVIVTAATGDIAIATGGGITMHTDKFVVTAADGNTAIAGTLAVTGASTLTGNVAMSGTLEVTGASTLTGNVTLAGDLIGAEATDIAIHTDKFTVTGSNGNTLIAGTLAVGGASTLTGNVGCSGTLTSTGNFTVGSSKVVVTATTGAIAIASTGSIAVDTNKFTVAGTGNTVIAGTLAVSGVSTYTNTLTVGVDDTGHDVKFFGATSGCSLLWDESEDQLVVTGPADVPALKIAGAGSKSAAAYAAAGTAWVDGGTPAFAADQMYLMIDVGGTVYRIPLWANA